MARRNIDVDKPWHRSIPFAQGVEVSGRVLFTAGITARDPDGDLIDVRAAAGATFEDIVKIVMYTTDIDGFSQHADVWHGYFVARPASTLVEVRRLALPEMTVEIEAVAHLGD